VILAGLVVATLLNTLVLPVACLRLGQAPDSDAQSDEDLAVAHTVPFPRQAPDVPGTPRSAAEPEHPAP
jgi:hypothetical protein